MGLSMVSLYFGFICFVAGAQCGVLHLCCGDFFFVDGVSSFQHLLALRTLPFAAS